MGNWKRNNVPLVSLYIQVNGSPVVAHGDVSSTGRLRNNSDRVVADEVSVLPRTDPS
jgi:hypothetical protein